MLHTLIEVIRAAVDAVGDAADCCPVPLLFRTSPCACRSPRVHRSSESVPGMMDGMEWAPRVSARILRLASTIH